MLFPCPVSPNADGVGASDMQTETGAHDNGSNFQIRLLARWIRSLPIGHTVWGGVCGNQCSAASLPATDSLIMNVCL